jgi:hypothetical protein
MELVRSGRLVLLVAILALLFEGDDARAGSSVFQLLAGFSAKESCSCAFVVAQTDAYCQAFGQQSGYTVSVAIDRGAKVVTSSVAGSTRTARFADGAGCTLDAP